MTEVPRVSIVTPTWNRAALLEQTIASIRAQSFTDYEHIVVDGASTDDTSELLSRIEGDYPVTWRSEPDHGMYDAINKGMALARGEILAYLNSDDLYFPWTLDVVVRTFDRHPDVDFVFGDALGIDDETGSRRLYWQLPFHRDWVCRSGFLAQPAVFWRRRAWEDAGPFEQSLRFVADCDFWMRASLGHRFHKVNEFLAIERDHGATLRSTSQDALERELREVRSRYVSLGGTRHRLLNARNTRRAQLWQRFYSLALLLQTRLPGGARFEAWRRFIQADGLELNAGEVFRQLLPRHQSALDAAMPASRRWLEPEA
jgi:glycosyltransferase involved in cell wall biosynthesis